MKTINSNGDSAGVQLLSSHHSSTLSQHFLSLEPTSLSICISSLLSFSSSASSILISALFLISKRCRFVGLHMPIALILLISDRLRSDSDHKTVPFPWYVRSLLSASSSVFISAMTQIAKRRHIMVRARRAD